MTSPTTGKPEPTTGERVAVELVHARAQHLRWILIGLVIGGLCVWGLGTLGKGVGALLLALGAWNAWLFVQTFRNPPGTLVIDGDDVVLPRGLCRGEPHKVRRADVGAVYFLRRSVPWTKAAPVLVVEAGGQAFSYPRDWFASESDQRRVLDQLTP